MKKQVTVVAFVLDESGSMDCSRDAAISGTNEYINSLKKEREEHPEYGEILFTLTTFSSATDGTPRIKMPYNLAEIKEVGLIGKKNYKPDGGTPLLEAVIKTINGIDDYLKDKVVVKPEEDAAAVNGPLAQLFEKKSGKPVSTEPDELVYKMIVVVQTDGGENTSASEYKPKSKLEALIKERETRGNWTFVFLGADIDATNEGMALGMSAGNTSSYANTAVGTGGTFRKAAYATNSIRGSSALCSANFAKTMEEAPEIVTTAEVNSIIKDLNSTSLKWNNKASKNSK